MGSPKSVTDGIADGEDERGLVQIDRRRQFAPGDPIRILDGVFTGCLGLSQRVADLSGLQSCPISWAGKCMYTGSGRRDGFQIATEMRIQEQASPR